MSSNQSPYVRHLRELMRRADAALQAGGLQHLLIASGVEKFQFLDDRPYGFAANPHFTHWLPLTQHPNCWLSYTPGKRPVLVYHQPEDFWHMPPTDPEGEWVAHFDVRVIRSPAEAAQHLPAAAHAAILGEADAAIAGHEPNNPAAVIDYLHWFRSYKTDYEIERLRLASQRAVRGHIAAEAAFREGASEAAIHRAYLAAAAHSDAELPYSSIVALNQHGAVLHYQFQDQSPPHQSRALLIDAGASVDGYAADITRTYANGDATFESLIAGVDQVQRDLVAQVCAGQSYADLHIDAHLALAGLLRELGLVDMAPEVMLESGVTSVFFPHGLGHPLGLQVHDVAGFQRGPEGGRIERPQGHPYLRMTRSLEAGMVVTIEPGIYFIDRLLGQLRGGPHANRIDWKLVEHLRAFGGVRIEDDVLCTAHDPENLTRDAFASA